jgi:hypothetical protein
MASEIQFETTTGQTCYVQLRNSIGHIYNTNTDLFESYVTANVTNYALSSTEQGSGSCYYVANMPTGILPGTYNIVAKARAGGSPAETDRSVAEGSLAWTGIAVGTVCGGDGAVEVNQDYGGTNTLTYVTSVGQGIDNASIRIYLTSEYEAGNRGIEFIIAATTTNVDGHWIQSAMLDPETYTIIFYKQNEFGPDRVDITVT